VRAVRAVNRTDVDRSLEEQIQVSETQERDEHVQAEADVEFEREKRETETDVESEQNAEHVRGKLEGEFDGSELEGGASEVPAGVLGRTQDVGLLERAGGGKGPGRRGAAGVGEGCDAGAEEEQERGEKAHLGLG